MPALFVLYSACSIIPIRRKGVRAFPKKNNKVALNLNREPIPGRMALPRGAGNRRFDSCFSLLSSSLSSTLDTLANLVFPGCLFQVGCTIRPHCQGESHLIDVLITLCLILLVHFLYGGIYRGRIIMTSGYWTESGPDIILGGPRINNAQNSLSSTTHGLHYAIVLINMVKLS